MFDQCIVYAVYFFTLKPQKFGLLWVMLLNQLFKVKGPKLMLFRYQLSVWDFCGQFLTAAAILVEQLIKINKN